MVTGTRVRPSSSNGSTSEPVSPGQPIQAPLLARITGSSAETSPPGERRQLTSPSSSTTRSTGSRLATTTRSAVLRLRELRLTFATLPAVVDTDLGPDLVHLLHQRDRLRRRHQ